MVAPCALVAGKRCRRNDGVGQHGLTTGTGADEKPSADAGSQEDVHGTGSQDASASGREDASGQKEGTDAPQESQEHVPQESVELKQPALPARKENVETKSDQKPEAF